MKVMMIAGYLHTGINKYFDLPEQNAGGWVAGMVEGIKNYPSVSLSYLALDRGVENKLIVKAIDGITYYLLNYAEISYLRAFVEEHECDLYHLFGIENEYSQDISKLIPLDRTLLYIQGLASEYEYHYFAGYDTYSRSNLLFDQYMKVNREIMHNRGIKEIELYRAGRFIAGRTDWDASFVYKLNNGANYFHLDETLRPVFYSAEKWNYKTVEKHSIFVTQASYPIKAPHMIVEIIKELKRHYPDVKCYIGGENLMEANSIATKFGISYASYIKNLIEKYQLTEQVIFLGSLSQERVIEQLQKTNVFLLSSSVENSPNSLQEAMIIGTPCVASNVGGISSIADHKESALLYPFDDVMLASHYIAQIFEDKNLAESLSAEAVKRIEYLANPEKNAKQLYDIYTEMHKTINGEL